MWHCMTCDFWFEACSGSDCPNCQEDWFHVESAENAELCRMNNEREIYED